MSRDEFRRHLAEQGALHDARVRRQEHAGSTLADDLFRLGVSINRTTANAVQAERDAASEVRAEGRTNGVRPDPKGEA